MNSECSKRNSTEEAALWILEKLKGHRSLDHKTTLTIKLGIEIILLSIPKFLLIYGLAALLHIFFEVLIFDSAYYFLRRKAYGAHATSNVFCLILSVLIFIGIPYMSQYFSLSSWVIVAMFITNSLILSFYAPAPTQKNPIYCEKKRKKLRFAALLHNGTLFALAALIPMVQIRMLISLGAVLSGCVVLPIFKGGK